MATPSYSSTNVAKTSGLVADPVTDTGPAEGSSEDADGPADDPPVDAVSSSYSADEATAPTWPETVEG